MRNSTAGSRNLTLLGLGTIALLVCLSHAAMAHGVHAPPSLTNSQAYVPPTDAGWWASLVDRIQWQFKGLLESVRQGDPLGPALSLLFLAFSYGILHAVGPGHGKLILASYMTATSTSVPTGITIAFVAALIQAAIAIATVLIMALGLSQLGESIPALQGYLGAASLLLLAVLGFMIVLRQLTALNLAPAPVAKVAVATSCSCCGHAHHHHEADHQPVVELPTSLGMWSVAMSMGVRPCTSAFVILLLALASDLLTLGILASLAMALGVACTLSLVAIVSVDASERASAWLERSWLGGSGLQVLTLTGGAGLTVFALYGAVTLVATQA
ncbi:MAG: hypothetical protein AAGF46_11015 [Pseudomonadota bacterium]